MSTPPDVANDSTTEQNTGSPRGWRRLLLPEPTPAPLLPEPRPIPAWNAYLALTMTYAVVFGYPIAGIVTSVRADRAAPRTPAPTPDTYWAMALPGWIMHAILLVLVAVCVALVCWRRRITVGALFAPQRPDLTSGLDRPWWRRQGRQVFVLAFAAVTAWMVASTLLGRLLPGSLVGGFAIENRTEALWTVAMLGPTQVTTALVEEPIVVAVLIVLLTAARRPVAEIYTVAILAKLAYHAYYGLAVLALIPTALVIVWLYRRTGRLWPIIAAHAAYNLAYSALVIAWPPIAAA